jgi:hypothetical protein
MHLEKAQSRQRTKEIRALWREFDPIGVYASPDSGCPPDEYDNYLAPCLRLLEQRASTEDLAKYLSYIVGEYMGLGEPELFHSQSVEFAGKLQQWYSSAWLGTHA